MKSGIPWNLRAVDEETREAVIKAARRSGQTVGEWLNQVLAEEGEGYAEPEDTAPQPSGTPAAAADLGAAIAQLRNRLDEIEEIASRRPDARAEASERPRKQKSVQEMVAELAREIENPDERARSMVEGLRDRSAAPREQPKPGPGRIDDAIRELDERIAAMGGRIADPSPDDAKPSRLDDIRYHLNALLAETPKPAQATTPEMQPPQALPETALVDAALRALESRIDDAMTQLGAREAKAAEPPSATAEQIVRVEARLAEIGEKLAAAEAERQKPRKDAEIASAIREISAHQHTIDDRAETLAMRRDQKALSAAMAALRTDIGSLGEQVSAISRIGAEEHGAFFDIARRIEALAADKPIDRNLLAAIRADLETLHSMVDGARQSTLGSIEERHNGIAAQINDLMIRTPDRSRVEALGEEVAALRHALESDDSPRAIQRLEMRVTELGRGIETALGARQAQPDPALARLEERLHEISGRLGGLMDTAAHTAAIEAAQRQLESHLEDVVVRLGGMFQAAPQQATLATLHERLTAITERIDGLSASQREPAVALDAIKAEIGAFRAEIAGRPALQPAPSTEHLEKQVHDLAAQLETVASSSSEGKALADLEVQVAHLASELEQTRPRAEALHRVEESLDRLQSLLADTAQESMAGARAEARKAVDELSEVVAGNDVESDLVRGLMSDLDNLRSAAGSTDDMTRSKLESVGQTLTQVVDRLGRLETEATSAAARTAGKRRASILPTRAASIAGAWTAVFKGGAATNSGAGKQPASGSNVAPIVDRRAADRRVDFIAAARRAAQAAADEAASAEAAAALETAASETTSEVAALKERKPGAFARISQAIRNRKRPLLLAAAAIVLAIGAMQVYGKLSTATEESSLISAVGATTDAQPSQFRDVVAESTTAPLPTMPRVTEQAMVAPTATADPAIAFAKPEIFASRFDINPNVPDSGGFGTADETAAAVDTPPDDDAALGYAPETAGVTLASAETEAQFAPAATTASGLDARLGSQKLLAAADGGDPAAAFEIATRYAEGTRVPKDLAKAAEWYARAAEGGVAVAQYRLGSLYERGQGVPKDPISAVNWYQRAADQGNVNAMHNLAVLMSEGVEGPADHDKALQWFLAAGNYGVRDSQYNLGVIYARGLGPAQDLIESYKWFAIAAAQGDTDAAARREEVAKAMVPDDLAKARAAVTAWHIKAPIAEANGVSAPGGGWDGPGDTIGEADRQALVAKIQTLLAEQGFDPGPADGVAGPKTVDAVRAYQRKVGQPETGQIDHGLVAALSDNQM